MSNPLDTREEVLFELRRIGRELSQLTGRLNAGQPVPQEAVLEALQAVTEAAKEIRAFYRQRTVGG